MSKIGGKIEHILNNRLKYFGEPPRAARLRQACSYWDQEFASGRETRDRFADDSDLKIDDLIKKWEEAGEPFFPNSEHKD